MIEIGILALASMVNILLGLFVYFKNPRSTTNKLFLGLTLSLTIWSVANYISTPDTPFIVFSHIVWVRLVLFSASLLSLLVYLTFAAFPDVTFELKRIHRLAICYAVFVMGLTLTPLVFTLNQAGQPAPNAGIPFFTLLALWFLGGGVVNLIKKYHRSTGIKKTQIELIILGVSGTFGLILISNLFLVVIFDVVDLIIFGPAFTLIFSGSLAYAIIRHKLFDIRAAVARSVAYLLSLAFIGLVYGLLAFGISSLITTSGEINSTQRAIYIGFALLTALIFQPIRKFFDRITNQLFYRDAYDTEEFLDGLNRTLVAKVDLEPLLKDVAELIEQNLKAQYCVFAIRETSYFPERIIGTKEKELSRDDIEQLHETTPKIHHRVILADQLEVSQHGSLERLLRRNDVEVLARLVTTVKYNIEGIGYLILGPKKSGNPYTKQDENIIRIVANELVIAVQNALRFEEIEEFNVTLQQKVDSATRKLRRTNEKLKTLDETKDEFISMASHQLRTPLTSVKGYLSMVMEGDAGKISGPQKKLLDQAFISSQRMVYLIADLLNVSRLKTGKFIIENKPTNLAEVVEGEISQLVETAASRKLELKYDKPSKFPELMLDETKIRQVIMNFVDNAIYYTPSGGHIEVKVTETDKAIEFRVIDDGIGIPKHEQHHMFSKFYRAGNAKKARPDGTGLGIFMAKKVIVAQGGSIIFSSEEGKGSTFGFSFSKDKLVAGINTKQP